MTKKTYSLHSPVITKNDISSVSETLKSGWVSTSGKIVNKFENKISKKLSIKYAVALNSGTSALHLAMQAVGVKQNDEVIISTLSFIAPINAIKYNRAFPIFMDVDNHLNIDVNKTLKFLSQNTYFYKGNTYNKRTKRIVRGSSKGTNKRGYKAKGTVGG